MSRLPTTDRAFEQWMQSVEDRLDRVQRGQVLRGRPSFGDSIVVGDVTISAVRNPGDGTTAVVMQRAGGTAVTLVTLS